MRILLLNYAYFLSICFLLTSGWNCPPADAAGFYCEVIQSQGNPSLVSADGTPKPIVPGDLLQPNDTLQTDEAGFVTLALDIRWNNTARIGPSSRVLIHSINPTDLRLTEGDIFARLDRLPIGTVFEVKTPVAVAAVRGSRFRTFHRGIKTDVFNFDKSKVYVFGRNSDGSRRKGFRLLGKGQSATVDGPGKDPSRPAAFRSGKAGELPIAERVERKLDQSKNALDRAAELQNAKKRHVKKDAETGSDHSRGSS